MGSISSLYGRPGEKALRREEKGEAGLDSADYQ
jgi:hypothetical protein